MKKALQCYGPIGTLVLLIVLLFKNTMLFTRTKNDTVKWRYDPINMTKLPGGQIVRIVLPKFVILGPNNVQQ